MLGNAVPQFGAFNVLYSRRSSKLLIEVEDVVEVNTSECIFKVQTGCVEEGLKNYCEEGGKEYRDEKEGEKTV